LALRDPVEDHTSAYSCRNSSKGALIAEASILFSYLAKGNFLDSTRQAIFRDNIFLKDPLDAKEMLGNIAFALLSSRTNFRTNSSHYLFFGPTPLKK
jgi:hypothetical protein